MYESDLNKQLPSPSMFFTLRGRVRGTSGPPSSRSHLLTNLRPKSWHAVRCHCSSMGVNLDWQRLLCTSLWPCSLVEVRGFFAGFSSFSSYLSDSDLFLFLGEVACTGLGNVFFSAFCWFWQLQASPFLVDWALPSRKAWFYLWWHLIRREIISECFSQPIDLCEAACTNNDWLWIKCRQTLHT